MGSYPIRTPDTERIYLVGRLCSLNVLVIITPIIVIILYPR